MSDDAMVSVLAELERFLRVRKYYGHADVVERAIDLHSSDRSAFVEFVQGGSFWGGSGAVWEIGIAEFRDEFWRLIVRVAGVMEASGIGTPRSRDIGVILEHWIRSAV